jgi:hypothetical protein
MRSMDVGGVERVPLHESALEAPVEARDGATRVEAPEPVAVKVWIVTARGKAFLSEQARAIAWTSGWHPQVQVEYLDRGGRVGFAWVWASAVRRA